MSLFASSNFEISVLMMRLFNALLFVALVSSTILLSPRALRVAIVGGITITIVPLGMFLVPSVNPSSWAITSAAVLWGAAYAFLNAQNRMNKWLLFGLATLAVIVGAGARGDAAVYSVIAIMAAALLSIGRLKKQPFTFVAIGALAPIAAIFYFASGQSSVAAPSTSQGGTSLTLVLGNLAELPSLWVGSFGTWGLGWLDTQVPAITWVTAIFVFSGVIFFALGRTVPLQRVALGVLAFALIFIPMYVLVHDKIMVGAGVQPRYLLPLLIMFAGVALWNVSHEERLLTRLQLVIVTAGLVIANSLALHTNIRRYVTGKNQQGFNLDQHAEWWWNVVPFGPLATWGLGTACAAVTLALLASFIWPDRERNGSQKPNLELSRV